MSDRNCYIKTRISPYCSLCGTPGKEIHAGLTDQLFGAPGVWNLKQCPDAACGLIWLDPMPIEEDIAVAYQRYYTHYDQRVIKNAAIPKAAHKILKDVLSRATGLIREQLAIRTSYLGEQTPGKLLEYGCGAGDQLALMRTLGWTVEGVEIDPVACQRARQLHNLTVHEGTLESMGYTENSFDAILMHHVIEHVFDPVALLEECRRIIKPDGHVVVITPNAESWGYKIFRENWRGLEPPRHIHIFSPKTMSKCADLACYKKVTVTTTPANAEGMFNGSMHIKNNLLHERHDNEWFKKGRIILSSLFLQIIEHRLWKRNASLGEEVVMICQK
jgi:2-polyprenyl-3-methyl-5-hydroxy-6-metoxy-1,4-benzoquinol methylase